MARPLLVLCAGMRRTLLLLLASQKWGLVGALFISCCTYFAPVDRGMVVLGPFSSLYSVAGGEVCPGASTAAESQVLSLSLSHEL